MEGVVSGVYYAVGRILADGLLSNEAHLLFWAATYLSPTNKVVHCGGEDDPAAQVTSWNLGDVTCRTCARRAFDVLDDQIQAVERVFLGDDPAGPEPLTGFEAAMGRERVDQLGRLRPDPLAALSDDSTTDDW